MWGVETFIVDPVSSTDAMVDVIDRELLKHDRCTPGDRIVLVAGVPPGVSGTTNGMRVHIMGMKERDRPVPN